MMMMSHSASWELGLSRSQNANETRSLCASAFQLDVMSCVCVCGSVFACFPRRVRIMR